MIGKQVEDRIEFDADTRREVLKKTGFRCAACGEKLDMVRHTIDHIIPISRGGTNNVENLIGLCKICNEYKDNLVFYPGDYYTYLTMTNTKVVGELHHYVVDYLKNEVHKFNLRRYPLISPCCTAMGYLNGVRPKTYMRQLLFDIIYMRSDMRRANCTKVNFLKDYAYYAVIKRSTQNLIAIIRLDYCVGKEKDDDVEDDYAQLTVFDEWESCNQKTIGPLMKNISEVISTRYIELGIKLNEVCIASRTEKIPDMVYDSCVKSGFGWFDLPLYAGVSTGTLHDRDDLGLIPYCYVEFRNKSTEVSDSEHKE